MRPLLLAALLLLAPPLAVRACDMAAMDAELTRICRAALDPVLAWLAAVTPPAEGKAAIDQARDRAIEACDTGDPAIGAAEAVRLARLAGRIEASAGLRH